MSKENVELARRLYPGTVDVVSMVAESDQWLEFFEPFVHPRFETVGIGLAMGAAGGSPVDGGMMRTVHGIQGFLEVWREFLAAWESWVATAAEFIDVDEERVLVYLDISARTKTHGVEIPIEGANLLTFHEGRVKRLEMYVRREEGRKAAGLSE
jgi:hypothetical protein